MSATLEEEWPEDAPWWAANLQLACSDMFACARPLPAYDSQRAQDLCNGSLPSKDKRPAAEPYLYPMMNSNEVKRLRELWYYTRGVAKDQRLIESLEKTVDLVRELLGCDSAIFGLSDADSFYRIATSNMSHAVLTRRESTCSYTLSQPPGTIVQLPDLLADWRFAESPAVKNGLRAYFGTQLTFSPENGQEPVVLGSLCVASFQKREPLTQLEQKFLLTCADTLTRQLVDYTRLQRHEMSQIMASRTALLHTQATASNTVELVTLALQELVPRTKFSIFKGVNGILRLPDEINIDTNALIDHVWEDTEAIENYVTNQNHLHSIPGKKRTLRALVIPIPDSGHSDWLVLRTADLRHTFDKIDVSFVQSCARFIAKAEADNRLEAALIAKVDFIRSISHNLRTPINGVMSSCELLNEQFGPNATERCPQVSISEQITPLLELIKISARDLLAVVNNVIDLGEIESAQMEKPKLDLVPIRQLEFDVLRSANDAHRQDSQAVVLVSDFRLPSDIDYIHTDAVMLKQCVNALISSAYSYTKSGSLTLCWSLTDDHDALVIEVIGTGLELSEAARASFFNTFKHGDATEFSLGPAIASKHAQSLGAKLAFCPTTGKGGNHLRLTLPQPGFACSRRKASRQLREAPKRALCHIRTRNVEEETALRFLGRDLVSRNCALASFQAADYICALASAAVSDSQLFANLQAHQILICFLDSNLDGAQRMSLSSRPAQTIFSNTPISRVSLDAALADARRMTTRRHVRQESKESSGSDWSESCTSLASFTPNSPPRPLKMKTKTQPPRSDLRLLLVDDNPVNCEILRMYCRKRRYEYVLAENGQIAVDKYVESTRNDQAITLVLMDLQMPVMNGSEATSQIRAFEKRHGLQRTPILMVTAQSLESDRQNSLKSGADNFFTKPLSLKVLDGFIEVSFPL